MPIAPVALLAMQQNGLAALTMTLSVTLGVASIGCVRQGALPVSIPAASTHASSIEQLAIEQREICVGSSIESAGVLGDTLYYRAATLPDGKLAVGYFAFFSEERPWGNNWLTWTVLPAVAVDMFYTRAMFVGPGLQRAIHGKGDVEGFHIVYTQRPDGTLDVERGVADDGSHELVNLSREQILALDPQRPTFYTDVWSHQLGGHGARAKSELSYLHCYGPGHVRELPDGVSDEFALAGRAPPAHVEALGGTTIGAPMILAAKVPPPAPM
jgi:hypothetical protein